MNGLPSNILFFRSSFFKKINISFEIYKGNNFSKNETLKCKQAYINLINCQFVSNLWFTKFKDVVNIYNILHTNKFENLGFLNDEKFNKKEVLLFTKEELISDPIHKVILLFVHEIISSTKCYSELTRTNFADKITFRDCSNMYNNSWDEILEFEDQINRFLKEYRFLQSHFQYEIHRKELFNYMVKYLNKFLHNETFLPTKSELESKNLHHYMHALLSPEKYFLKEDREDEEKLEEINVDELL